MCKTRVKLAANSIRHYTECITSCAPEFSCVFPWLLLTHWVVLPIPVGSISSRHWFACICGTDPPQSLVLQVAPPQPDAVPVLGPWLVGWLTLIRATMRRTDGWIRQATTAVGRARPPPPLTINPMNTCTNKLLLLYSKPSTRKGCRAPPAFTEGLSWSYRK